MRTPVRFDGASRPEGRSACPPPPWMGVLYFGSNDGRLYALDASSGAPIWTSADTGGQIDRAVAIAGGVVYAGWTTDATFDAFEDWTADLVDRPPGPQTSSPAYADGRVYVASGLDSSAGTHLVYAIDARTGLTAWRWSTRRAPSSRSTSPRLPTEWCTS